MQSSSASKTVAATVTIVGVNVQTLSLAELLEAINQIAHQQQHAIIAHANAHGLNLAVQTPWFRQFLNDSTIVFCDGFGVKWGAKLLGHNIPERITYADWTWQLAEFAAAHDLSMYFVGSRPGVAERAAQRLKERYPALQVLGTQDGYFDKTQSSAENDAAIARINAARPNILIVGFGMPLQEQWLAENWHRIDANVALTGGAVFDYISGDMRRGPRWMTDHGLEWLARLIIEPRRLWQRYVLGNPLFVWRVLLQRFGLLRLKP